MLIGKKREVGGDWDWMLDVNRDQEKQVGLGITDSSLFQLCGQGDWNPFDRQELNGLTRSAEDVENGGLKRLRVEVED
jgi:hypothetical protein